jgi:hypothetical protein
MGLPKIALKKETVELPDGQTVELRSLSRADVQKLGSYENESDAEKWAISAVLGASMEEVEAWYNETPSDAVAFILDKILVISGLREDSQKK